MKTIKKVLAHAIAPVFFTLNGYAQFNCLNDRIQVMYDSLTKGKQDARKVTRPSNLNLSASKLASQQYIIPVVFHVFDDLTNPSYIPSENELVNILEEVNKAFARERADTNLIATPFKNIYVNSNIKFMLAKKDPSGNCTSGITFYNSPKAIWDFVASFSPGYMPTWDPTKYLNVILVNEILNFQSPLTLGVGGYSSFPWSYPTGSPQDAMVMVRRDADGLTHEFGHWLGLDHVFGSAPNLATCGDDGIADTPSTSNPRGEVPNCPSSLSGNACNGNGTNNIENFMHYYGCMRNFTQGQTAVMQAVLNSTLAGRNNLSTAANLSATGVNLTPTCTPNGLFRVFPRTICQNSTISFTNVSYGGTPLTWQWYFPGGTPSVSTNSMPSVTYTSTGNFLVSLKVTNSAGSDSVYLNNYIKVMPSVNLSTTINESFENSGSLPNALWTNLNVNGNTWALTNDAAATGSTSIRVFNIPNNYGTAMLTTKFRVNADSSIITFKHAYAPFYPTTYEHLFVSMSIDCGNLWHTIFKKSGFELSSIGNTTVVGNFVPTANQWLTDTVYLSNYLWADEVMLRFDFQADNREYKGSDMYIDDINLVEALTTGIGEVTNTDIPAIYPNPFDKTVKIINVSEMVSLKVFDYSGRLLRLETPYTKEFELNLENLPSGLYFLEVRTNKTPVVRKIVRN